MRKALASSVSDCAAATMAATLRPAGAAKTSAMAWSWARRAVSGDRAVRLATVGPLRTRSIRAALADLAYAPPRMLVLAAGAEKRGGSQTPPTYAFGPEAVMWELGVTFLELILGENPFRGDSAGQTLETVFAVRGPPSANSAETGGQYYPDYNKDARAANVSPRLPEKGATPKMFAMLRAADIKRRRIIRAMYKKARRRTGAKNIPRLNQLQRQEERAKREINNLKYAGTELLLWLLHYDEKRRFKIRNYSMNPYFAPKYIVDFGPRLDDLLKKRMGSLLKLVKD